MTLEPLTMQQTKAARAIAIAGLSFTYPKSTTPAVNGLDLDIDADGIFALLGPNGSGKTTVFQILSTLLRPQSGSVQVFGIDVRKDPVRARLQMGVIFQSPGLDKKLTVLENLQAYGPIYGIKGKELALRIDSSLNHLGITEQKYKLVGELSGGLARRADIAKSLLARPRLILMDEPTTALDPTARLELWEYLKTLCQNREVTVVMTTHLMEDADKCDRLAIMDRGRLVAQGSPQELKDAVGADIISIKTEAPQVMAREIADTFGGKVSVVDGLIRMEQKGAHELIPRLAERFGERLRSLTLSKPSLEDVFIRYTGRGLEGKTHG